MEKYLVATENLCELMTHYLVHKGFSETLTLSARYFQAQKHHFNMTKIHEKLCG